jgi:hypothetical protein
LTRVFHTILTTNVDYLHKQRKPVGFPNEHRHNLGKSQSTKRSNSEQFIQLDALSTWKLDGDDHWIRSWAGPRADVDTVVKGKIWEMKPSHPVQSCLLHTAKLFQLTKATYNR